MNLSTLKQSLALALMPAPLIPPELTPQPRAERPEYRAFSEVRERYIRQSYETQGGIVADYPSDLNSDRRGVA